MIKKICKVEGCDNQHYGNGYCKKHYKQIETHGHILQRTRFMTNEIIEDKKNNVAYIILYDLKQNEKARCIIDLEDIEKVKHYRWSFKKDLYVAHIYEGSKERKLVNFIVDNIEQKIVHYKNGDALDCRKNNLTFNKNEAGKRCQTLVRNINNKCKIEGCEDVRIGQGYCWKHYNKFVRKAKKGIL